MTTAVVTQKHGGDLGAVTTAYRINAALDRYDIDAEMLTILPARLADAGWEMVNDSPSFWLAAHPKYGATGAVYYAGHGVHLVRQRLVDMITALAPQEATLTTAVSHRLITINENVGELEALALQLTDQLQRLAQHCTGAVRYRVAASGTHFLYTDHTAGTNCPYCGSHPEGKRLRKYHGEEGTVTADNAMAAVTARAEWEAAGNQLDKTRRQLQQIDRLVWQLESITK
jgi:hypothetical protein